MFVQGVLHQGEHEDCQKHDDQEGNHTNDTLDDHLDKCSLRLEYSQRQDCLQPDQEDHYKRDLSEKFEPRDNDHNVATDLEQVEKTAKILRAIGSHLDQINANENAGQNEHQPFENVVHIEELGTCAENGLSDVQRIEQPELKLLLLENEVDDAFNLRYFEELHICFCQKVQQVEADFSSEVEVQLHFECLGHESLSFRFEVN